MSTRQRLPRAERREQIMAAATRAFARSGFDNTGLDEVAAEAEVSPVILYRHFASKSDLYRAVLDRTCTRLVEAVGAGDYDESSLPGLLRAAAADPDGFRLLFRHATREPEFRDVIDRLRSDSARITDHHLDAEIPPGPWRDWAAQLVPAVATEGVIAWLDAGQPDPRTAATRIQAAITGVVRAAAQVEPRPSPETRA